MKEMPHRDKQAIRACFTDDENAGPQGYYGVLANIADPQSVIEAAHERVPRFFGNGMSEEAMTRLAALWVDAFMTGTQFQRTKGQDHP